METPTVGCISVSERISEIGESSPHSIALRSGDLTLTYRQLNLAAARFARCLAQLGVAPGDPVAICMERSFDWIVAALATLRLGAAYVPLDSEWPESRLRFALENSGATALVSRTLALERIQSPLPGIDPAREAHAIASAPPLALAQTDAEDLAYIIYTSGSTGVPKGVEVTHANLAHLVDWHHAAFALTPHDRASHLAGLGFDAAVWEIWPCLAAGATLCLAPDSIRSSPELIQQWMLSERITIAFVPTVLAAPMVAEPLAGSWPRDAPLRLLLTGGDTLHRAPAASLPFQVVNNYGPTECTVVSTSTTLSPGAPGFPPIGRAIAGARVYLIDNHGAPVPDGQVGELYIGGNGVARGYRNLPELTQQSFLPDPFATTPGARMYRSGDRALRRPDGELEFRGRIDRQAKVRGHRIELDEIASVLHRHPSVAFATAAIEDSGAGENQIVAYVLPASAAPVPTAHDLQDHLLRSLPHYMVPAIFVRLSALPLSPSGKLNVALLPKSTGAPLLPKGAASKPTTPIEDKLLALVQSLLQNDAVTTEDNFFLAGGHSLLGMQLIMRVRSTFGVDLSLRQLFEAPTAEHLALLIEMQLAQDRLTAIWKDLLGVSHIAPDAAFSELGADEALIARLQRRIVAEFGRHVTKIELAQHSTIQQQAELMHGAVRDKLALPPGVVSMQPNGVRDSIFWLHYPCANLVKTMGDDRPFLYVTLVDDDLNALGDRPTLQSVAACFCSKIVEAQPAGPYTLGGFCLGGILAYEVAAQLQAAGREVSHLVLIDPPSPRYYNRTTESLAIARHPLYLARKIAQVGLRASVSKIFQLLSMRLSVHEERKFAPQEQAESVQMMIEASASRYVPSTFEGDVSLIMAAGHPPHVNYLLWWQELLPCTPHIQFVDGHHLGLTEAPAVHEVAAAINSQLARPEDQRLLAGVHNIRHCNDCSALPVHPEIEDDEEEQSAPGWRVDIGSMNAPISAASK
jgi:amino acid adenylation domain-containing protein